MTIQTKKKHCNDIDTTELTKAKINVEQTLAGKQEVRDKVHWKTILDTNC